MNGFDVGSIYASLKIEGIENFHRDLQSAGDALDRTGQRGASFGKAAESAVRTAAGATTALVTAASAYLTILTKQGIAYNSLQQNSRAALTTLLGDSEKANAQMARLDDFARNSPFAKNVFIQAQQQLLGFGVEARKVIPYLDAIQNAVAATGGSSARVGELATIIAQIQSSAKITATDLREFGNRGVDAAQIIGSEMGKTAAQIRDEITAGTLDATVALDALAAGMQNKFGGTTELVKQQWSGAVDRVKAANRDLGAAIAEPFVSAQGGGMAVTWGNQVADVLRAIEKQAVPVMGILTQRGMPFFANVTRDLDSLQQRIARWDASTLDRSLGQLSGHAPGVAALAGAVLALGANVGPLGQLLRVAGISANPLLAAFVGLAAASPELRASLKGILDEGKPLIGVVGDLATILSGGLNSAIPLVAGGLDLLAGGLRVAVRLIEAIPAPLLAGVAAFLAMQRATGALHAPLTAATSGLSAIVKAMGESTAARAFNAGLSPTSALLAGVGSAASGAKAGVTGLGTAMKTAFLSNPIGVALTVVASAVGLWAMANAAAQQKVEAHRSRVVALKDSLNQTTGALTEATEKSIAAELAQGDHADSLKRIGYSQVEATAAILEGGKAYEELRKRIEENISVADADSDSMNASADAKRLSNEAGNALLETVERETAAIRESQAAVREKIQADRDAAAAMTEAGRSNQRFNDALQVARDITQDAETRVRALIQALDELKGGTISAEDAQIRLVRTAESLAEGFARTDEAGNSLWASLLDASGGFEISSGAASDLAEMMGRARREMADAAMTASDQALANGDLVGAVNAARAAGEGYISTLRTTMEQAGLTQEQINGLIGKYLDIPSVVATLLTDNGTFDEATQQVLALALELGALPEGETITIDEPKSPEIISRLEALGYKVKHLPNGQITITQTGASSVEATLNYLTRYRETTIGVRYVGGGPDYGSGQMTRADGGLDVHAGGGLVQTFANGGFPSGIYRGGPPIYKFAEPETGWEAFISGKPGQEKRNAQIAIEALRRLGFPSVPLAALGGVRGFADGGITGDNAAQAFSPGASITNWNITQNYPVHSDPFEDAWNQANEKGLVL